MKIERLGFIGCKWSGFQILIDDESHSIGEGWSYKEHALVLGFWVFQWRTWYKET